MTLEISLLLQLVCYISLRLQRYRKKNK